MARSLNKEQIIHFIQESNGIEGIYHSVNGLQITLYETLLGFPQITLNDLMNFVHITDGTVKLRDVVGLNVEVGDFVPPSGGPEITEQLKLILHSINTDSKTPFQNYKDYETLHPFTDVNGRSGRILWLWQVLNHDHKYYGSFLHSFHYQALR